MTSSGTSSSTTTGASTTNTTSTTTNSYNTTNNRNLDLQNVGNISFGDSALNALSGGNSTYAQYIPYAIGLCTLLILATIFKRWKS